jgi:hypothetical protein
VCMCRMRSARSIVSARRRTDSHPWIMNYLDVPSLFVCVSATGPYEVREASLPVPLQVRSRQRDRQGHLPRGQRDVRHHHPTRVLILNCNLFYDLELMALVACRLLLAVVTSYHPIARRMVAADLGVDLDSLRKKGAAPSAAGASDEESQSAPSWALPVAIAAAAAAVAFVVMRFKN